MVSDSVGRKTAFSLTLVCTTVFGFATAAAPSYHVRVKRMDGRFRVLFVHGLMSKAPQQMRHTSALYSRYVQPMLQSSHVKHCISCCTLFQYMAL